MHTKEPVGVFLHGCSSQMSGKPHQSDHITHTLLGSQSVMTRETLGKGIRQFFGTVKKELKTKGKRAEGDPNKVANCQ